ncbi:ABC transporter ATP-binding protein [Lentzea aerocolonigenes]|uniref:ABC transporter ATP-binding protein n=1 Tax=Lentzea aerocolonigenes TaxID=68170 RepID=A0A0F0GGN6_LENAE|nr:AAA family ATPase [Lentzea aerocolonigenes]KJK42505.1 ABC transporter ATP-binding protein [Lentzea aerocolonigenes]
MTFIRQIRLDEIHDTHRYPFTLPVVQHLIKNPIELTTPVTFLVGDNGAGKSTLVEAIAVAAGFNAEGGTQSFNFATKATESSLGDYLTLSWGTRKPRTGFFLRAESFYNVATEIDRIGQGIHASYGGKSLHERSHGESFMDLMTHRFGGRGLYVLDEPEAALSVKGCLTVLRRMHELVNEGSQFIIATHSPILLAAPNAQILEITDGEIDEVPYDAAEPVALTRNFLGEPDRFLRHLLD